MDTSADIKSLSSATGDVDPAEPLPKTGSLISRWTRLAISPSGPELPGPHAEIEQATTYRAQKSLVI